MFTHHIAPFGLHHPIALVAIFFAVGILLAQVRSWAQAKPANRNRLELAIKTVVFAVPLGFFAFGVAIALQALPYLIAFLIVGYITNNFPWRWALFWSVIDR